MRMIRIKENYKDGLYGNPADEKVRERVLRMLEDAPEETDDMFNEAHLDREVAKMENQIMVQNPNIVYIVNGYDNHLVHAEEHNIFRKQPEYQKLKMTDPKTFMTLEATFMQHMNMHQKFIAQMQEQMMEQAMAEKGKLGEGK
jgi:hypothetical protein